MAAVNDPSANGHPAKSTHRNDGLTHALVPDPAALPLAFAASGIEGSEPSLERRWQTA